MFLPNVHLADVEKFHWKDQWTEPPDLSVFCWLGVLSAIVSSKCYSSQRTGNAVDIVFLVSTILSFISGLQRLIW